MPSGKSSSHLLPHSLRVITLPNGEEKIVTWNNANLYDDKGEIIGTISSGEDITARKILIDMGYDVEVPPEWEDMVNILRSKPGQIKSPHNFPDDRREIKDFK